MWNWIIFNLVLFHFQPKFTWRKDGNKIGSGGKYIIFDNGNLFLRQVNVADTGVYTCEAANEHGKAESTGRLIVKQGPTFNTGTKPNPRVIARIGERVELRCHAKVKSYRYNASQKHESTLLHTYVLNEFLTADRPCTTKFFWKNTCISW